MSKSVKFDECVRRLDDTTFTKASKLADGPPANRRHVNYEVWLKYVSLVVLVIQNAGQVLLIRYTTTRGRQPFLKTVLVFFSEVVKCVAACLLLWASHRSLRKTLVDLRVHFVDNFVDTLKVGVPALIYTVQNFLLYVSIENLDVGTYMVTYQLKTLTTALFTVLMLKRRLSIFQWLALVVLCCGVAIVQMSATISTTKSKTGDLLLTPLANSTVFVSTTANPPPLLGNLSTMTVSSALSATVEKAPRHQNPVLGFFAVISACFLSGFSGIYFEKILKGSDASVWLRNVQLAALSIPIGVGMIAVSNSRDVLEHGLLQGFDPIVWLCVGVQALGGLIVAVVIKYADNILKAFATSFAIIVSSTASILLFEHYPTLLFCGGAALVITAVIIYGTFPYRPGSAARSDSTAGEHVKSASAGGEENRKPAESLAMACIGDPESESLTDSLKTEQTASTDVGKNSENAIQSDSRNTALK